MYMSIKQCISKPIRGRILGISGLKNFIPLIDDKNSEITDTLYPEVDFQNLPFKDNSFDYVISDQVLEHIENPKKAISESFRVLKNDGIAVHTTCFLNYFHPSPLDYWRFSPNCLKYLCEDVGFSKILQSEGWGNRLAILLCFISNGFRFMKIKKSKWNILYKIAILNEINYPIVTWVIAKK